MILPCRCGVGGLPLLRFPPRLIRPNSLTPSPPSLLPSLPPSLPSTVGHGGAGAFSHHHLCVLPRGGRHHHGLRRHQRGERKEGGKEGGREGGHGCRRVRGTEACIWFHSSSVPRTYPSRLPSPPPLRPSLPVGILRAHPGLAERGEPLRLGGDLQALGGQQERPPRQGRLYRAGEGTLFDVLFA